MIGTDAMLVQGGVASDGTSRVMLHDLWVLNLATYVTVGSNGFSASPSVVTFRHSLGRAHADRCGRRLRPLGQVTLPPHLLLARCTPSCQSALVTFPWACCCLVSSLVSDRTQLALALVLVLVVAAAVAVVSSPNLKARRL